MVSKNRAGKSVPSPEAHTAPKSLISDFDHIGSPQTVSPGKVLFRQGQRARGIFLLRRGLVRLSMRSAKGRKLHFRTVGPGYLLGVPANLGRHAYNFTAEVLEDGEVVFIERQVFLEALRQRPGLPLRVVQILSGELLGMPRTRRIRKGPAISS